MDNYNYPMGADTKEAPWNENDQPEKLFGITVSCNLSKDVGITSIDYDSDDKLNCPWNDYAASEYTPSEIIEFAKQCAEYMLSNKDFKIKSNYDFKNMIDSCTGWNIDEENAEQV
jgi:hypothetical protein